MKLNTLSRALVECERFQATARVALRRLEKEKYPDSAPTKEGAACKRASMDLSRVLADLRQGR